MFAATHQHAGETKARAIYSLVGGLRNDASSQRCFTGNNKQALIAKANPI